MVLQMIDLNPSLRPTFDNLLSSARGTAFPTSFYDFYHTYVHSVEELPSPSPFSTSHPPSTHSNATHNHPSSKLSNISTADGTSTPTSAHPSVFSASSHVTTFSHSSTAAHTTTHTSAAMGAGGVQETQGGRDGRNVESLPRNSDRRIDAIWEDFDAVVPWLNQELREGDENTNPNLGTVANRSGDSVSHALLVSFRCLRSSLWNLTTLFFIYSRTYCQLKLIYRIFLRLFQEYGIRITRQLNKASVSAVCLPQYF